MFRSQRRNATGNEPLRYRAKPTRALRRSAPHNPVWSRLATHAGVQAKLEVGAPDDEYEREADTVAAGVMRMPATAPPPVEEEETAGAIQTKPIGASYIQRLCSECEEERERETAPGVQAKAGMRPVAHGIPPSVQRAVSSPGLGAPLPREVRSRVESGLGVDLASVRVHSDKTAQQAARSIQAKAFTHQNHIYLGAGQSPNDLGLMAHEATHVVQQRGAAAIQRAPSFDECTDAQKIMVKATHDKAMHMLLVAVVQLMHYDGTTPAVVKKALQRRFAWSNKYFAKWVAGRLLQIALQAGSPQYECEEETEGRAWSAWCVPGTDIELRKNWFADPDIRIRAKTLIHEWYHRYGCHLDLGYHSGGLSPGHDTTRSILNADSWAWLVVDLS